VRLNPRVIDAVERVGVLALYAWLFVRLLQRNSLAGGLFQLTSEGIAVAFLLFRRPTEHISVRPLDWLLAVVPAITPLLVTGGLEGALLPKQVLIVVWFLGTFIQTSTKLWLGRNFGLVAARRNVVLGGPYRFVRHPMYMGYLITHVALLALRPTLLNAVLYALCWGFQVPRLMAEERILAESEDYAAYLRQVRWRLFPGVW
jgi:protein-S-isoprenylcysteine O-methyltransferase Ste14